MKLSGKIMKVEEREFTTKQGEKSKVKGVILQEITNDQYPQQAYIEYFGKWADEFVYQPGQVIVARFSLKVDEREHEGKKYYTQKLSGWRAELV